MKIAYYKNTGDRTEIIFSKVITKNKICESVDKDRR